MHRPRFAVGLFNAPNLRNDPKARKSDRDRTDKAMLYFLEALISVNLDYLDEYPNAPRLYDSGVFYKRVIERGQEDDDWADISVCLTLGYADCEDLVAWRCAELRKFHGIMARPGLTYQENTNGEWLYHIWVQYPNGMKEDPSRKVDYKGYYLKLFRA